VGVMPQRDEWNDYFARHERTPLHPLYKLLEDQTPRRGASTGGGDPNSPAARAWRENWLRQRDARNWRRR
jgi:hypothetical protein